MGVQVVLESMRALSERLERAIEFSRFECSSCDGDYRETDAGVQRHWEDCCAEHEELAQQYHATLQTLESAGYLVPDSWWLPAIWEPQIAYAQCDELDKAWIIGTMPRFDGEPHRADNSVPAGVSLPPGGIVTVSAGDAEKLSGVVDDGTVRAWEAIRDDIAATERRLVEQRLGVTNNSEPARQPAVESTNDERDAWMYGEKKAGRTHSQIRFSLEREHSEWDYIDTDQGIGMAIDRYCERQNLPPLRRKKQ